MLPKLEQRLLTCQCLIRAFKVAAFAALLVTVMLCSGCNRSLILEFVFPDGFMGVAKLRSGQASGMTLTETNGTISLIFPSSGVLDIKGQLPTLKWHKQIARYQSGKPITVASPPNQVAENAIALRSLGLKDNVEDWYLLGTAEQVQSALSKKYGFDVPKR